MTTTTTSADRRDVARIGKVVREARRRLRRRRTSAVRAIATAARWTHRNAEDVALVGGYALIAGGTFWIFGPAGLIVGGALSAGTALLIARGRVDVDGEG